MVLRSKDFFALFQEKERKGMKIYFCGSIRGGRQDADIYMKIIDQLKSYGEVLTEHVGYISIDETGVTMSFMICQIVLYLLTPDFLRKFQCLWQDLLLVG